MGGCFSYNDGPFHRIQGTVDQSEAWGLEEVILFYAEEDVNGSQKTAATQLNMSPVIHWKDKSSRISSFMQQMFELAMKNVDADIFFEQPNIPFSLLSAK